MIEAGLGGRYDATNVIPLARAGADERRPRAHALARADRSATSRARSSPSCATGATLVVGRRPAPRRARRGRAVAAPSRARGSSSADRRPRPPRCRRRAAIQRRNFALARAAAEAYLGHARTTPRSRPRRSACVVPGRLAGRWTDAAAHAARRRPQPGRDGRARRGAAASLVPGRRAARGRPSRSSTTRTRRACSPPCCRSARRVVFTRERQPARALARHARVAGRAARAGPSPYEIVPEPHRALARARELAGRGRRGRSPPARSTSSPTSPPAGGRRARDAVRPRSAERALASCR